MPKNEAMLLHSELEQGLLAVSRIEQRVSEIQSGTTGSVSIPTNGALMLNFLPKIIASFQHETLGTREEMRVHSSRRIASWVSGRQIDIGLIDTPIPIAGLNAELFTMECVCIMRHDDPLIGHETIHPEMLAGRSLIAITGDHAVDRQLDSLLAAARTQVVRGFSSYYFSIARNMVAVSGNITIIVPKPENTASPRVLSGGPSHPKSSASEPSSHQAISRCDWPLAAFRTG